MNKSARTSYPLRQLEPQGSGRERRQYGGARKRPPGLAKGSYKRNTSQRVSTIRTFLNYEPVYPWESAQPSRFTRALLARDGIDPDSISGEGEARKVLQALGRRKYKRLPAIRQLAGAADAGVDSETLWNLSYGL